MIQAGLNEVQTEAMLFIFIIYKVATIYNGKRLILTTSTNQINVKRD